jgi:uncharacterized protein
MELPQPLTEEEIEELDCLLLDSSKGGNSMCISMLDGLLTAIVSGPNTIMPRTWLPWVWDIVDGAELPQFLTLEHGKRFHELVLRHMNTIQFVLLDQPDQFEPILMENPNNGNPIQILDEWCMGYMTGINLDIAGWRSLMMMKPDWFLVIQLYGTELGWELLEEEAFDHAIHHSYVQQLPIDVRKIHQFWHAQRQKLQKEGRAHEQPDVAFKLTQPKIQTNDSCPCGSGKKFKQCHGSAGRLH